jgi:ribosomal protein S18 acetylase RimI-like enzyme
MRIVIRPAGRADRAILVAFLQQLQDAERAIHPSRLPGVEVADAYYETLTGRQADILIAESEGRPVGFVAGWLDEDPDPLQSADWRRHGAISDLFVTSDHRGEGVGQRLLRAISDRLQARGARRLRICSLASNAPAVAAYHRFGFTPFEITLDKPLS